MLTLDSLLNIKGVCVWEYVCIVYNKVPHLSRNNSSLRDYLAWIFLSRCTFQGKGAFLKVRWKSSRLPYIGMGQTVKREVASFSAHSERESRRNISIFWCQFFCFFLIGRPKQN